MPEVLLLKKIPYQILPNDTDTWQNDTQQTFPILIETELMEFLLKIGGVQMLNDVVLGPTKISDIFFLLTIGRCNDTQHYDTQYKGT